MIGSPARLAAALGGEVRSPGAHGGRINGNDRSWVVPTRSGLGTTGGTGRGPGAVAAAPVRLGPWSAAGRSDR